MERKIDRLDLYMKFSGLNDNKITAKTGLTVGVIGKSRKEGRDLSAKSMELILKKYPDLNPDWLLTGVGEMLKPAKNPFSQMTEQEIGEVSAAVRAEEWIRRYEAGEIFPAEIHHQIVAEKDKQIAELQRRAWYLEQQLKDLSK